jgi:hypothetical protein
VVGAVAPFRGNQIIVRITLKEVTGLLAHQPLELDSDEWYAMLRSHAIEPEMSAMLFGGDSVRFITLRQKILEKNLDEFLARMCEWNFEDTPPLSDFIIDDEAEDVTD